MDVLYEIEDRDGARFTWNVWPGQKAEATKNILPIACCYSPLKRGSHVQTVPYPPLQCQSCKACINPYCASDIASKTWNCPFCYQKNQFPQQYAGMSAANLPAELLPQMTTIEYQLTKGSSRAAPAFVFVVDTCLREEELEALKKALLEVLELLPETSHVSLITYGTTVQLYELAFRACPKSHAFSSKKAISSREAHAMLGIGALMKDNRIQASTENKFVVPLVSAQETLESIIEALEVDPFAVAKNKRPLRATGVALSVAVSVLENSFAGLGGRILLFMGGPCTSGPGMVVSDELKDPIRSHHELRKELAKHVHTATKFYDEWADRAASNGHAVDLFSCSLDQTGLLEMKQLVKATGGIMVLADSFLHDTFNLSLKKMFRKDDNDRLEMGLAGQIEVLTSRDLKVNGAIGHLTSLHKQAPNVAENEIGLGLTFQWKLCAIDPNSTYTFFFEVNRAPNAPANHTGMIQFCTKYQSASGPTILRVTTVAHTFADPALGPRAYLPGFDQEASAACIARLAVWKSEKEDHDSLKFLDTSLIKFAKRFCEYAKNSPASLQIPSEIALFPQFMFYLRRGPLIQVFNNSPDETVFFRYCLLREGIANSLVMIQPTLDSYTLDQDRVPVALSANSVDASNILLLDTFFHLIIHTGDTIAQWRKANYHLQEDYENLKELIESPQQDADDLMRDRLPHPMFVECDQRTSQARFLIATIDPTITHNTALPGMGPSKAQAGEVVFTEDANLQVFYEKLKEMTVREGTT